MANYTVELIRLKNEGINIFDFDYPIFDEAYRPILENRIYEFYKFHEIGFETAEMFKDRFQAKFNLIMPFYNKLYETTLHELDYVNNYDIKETIQRVVENDQTGVNTMNSDSSSTTNRDSASDSRFNDTPQARLSGADYATNYTEQKSSDDSTGTNLANSTSNSTTNGSSHEDFIRTMKGNIGITSAADLVMKYRQSLLNVDAMIIAEMRDMFMTIW